VTAMKKDSISAGACKKLGLLLAVIGLFVCSSGRSASRGSGVGYAQIAVGLLLILVGIMLLRVWQSRRRDVHIGGTGKGTRVCLEAERCRPTNQILLGGKFVKRRLRGLSKHGQWRGRGSISVSPDEVTVKGAHVASLRYRILLWLLILFLIEVPLLAQQANRGGSSAHAGLLAFLVAYRYVLAYGFGLSVLPTYLLGEYLLLDKSTRTIPWASVSRVVFDSDNEYVGMEFAVGDWLNSVVMRTKDWETFASILQPLDGLEASGQVATAVATPPDAADQE